MMPAESRDAIKRVQRAVDWVVRPDHIAVFVAIEATIPYYLKPPIPRADATLLEFSVSSATYIIGLVPWLLANSIHLLLFLPGFLILIMKIARPPAMR